MGCWAKHLKQHFLISNNKDASNGDRTLLWSFQRKTLRYEAGESGIPLCIRLATSVLLMFANGALQPLWEMTIKTLDVRATMYGKHYSHNEMLSQCLLKLCPAPATSSHHKLGTITRYLLICRESTHVEEECLGYTSHLPELHQLYILSTINFRRGWVKKPS